MTEGLMNLEFGVSIPATRTTTVSLGEIGSLSSAKEEQHNWTNDPQYLLDHIPVSVTNRTNDVSNPHPQRQNQEQE